MLSRNVVSVAPDVARSSATPDVWTMVLLSMVWPELFE
jgi:hypothetical protein